MADPTNNTPGQAPQAPRLDPSPIMRLTTAYWDAQVLLTANRMGLFTALGERTLSAEVLAQELNSSARHTALLLKACVGLGLLAETVDGFVNNPMGLAFLVAGKPGFMGNAIRYSDNLYGAWGQLETAVREGRPTMPAPTYLGDNPAITRNFVYGMHERALGIGRSLVGLVDLAGKTKMLDVGGGPGTYSALFAQRFPQLTSVVMDLPEVVAIAATIVADMGVGERVSTLAGDYFKDTFPTGNDVVMISGVFHRESEATCRWLIQRAADSLVSGGLLLISDVFTDASGNQPAFATLFGLNMMLSAPDGGVHADAAVAGWMREAGFATAETRPLPPPMPHRLIVGQKA